MANLDRAAAATMVELIVRQRHSSKKAPIPGSVLKLELTKRATDSGTPFDEQAIGFKTFFDFVSACPTVSVHRRPGSDFVVLPAGETFAEVGVSAPKRDRIRSDFWYGFVSFPVSGTRRAYDRANDRILYEEESKPVGSHPVIEPVSRDQQLTWRKEFAERLGEEGQALANALNGPNPFREFSIVTKRQPKWSREWNLFLLEKVLPLVRAWAKENDVSEDRWLISESNRKHGVLGRREVYAILDRIPLDRLMDLMVPLRWVLEAFRSEEIDKETN